MDSVDIHTLSDEDILTHSRKKEYLSDPFHPHAGENIFIITPSTLGKFSRSSGAKLDKEPSEAIVLRTVAEHTSIPVPRVLRTVQEPYESLIVMERIPGKQLSVVWPTMSDEEKSSIASTLRGYVKQLREIDIPRRAIPGPLGCDDSPLWCYSSPVFGQVRPYNGPFATHDDLITFFESRVRIANNSRKVRDLPPYLTSYNSLCGTCPEATKLVLVHQDLNPRNLILGEDGQLWVVDWTWAGFYPAWWEAVAMRAQAENEEMVRGKKDPSWDAIIPVVCGEFKELDEWYCHGAAGTWSYR